jgi:hypothetical protein
VKSFLALAALVVLGSCAGPPETLVVKTYQLRDQARTAVDDPMVRMEKGRRLRGAVSMEERRLRLGQYFTLLWSDPGGVGDGPVEVVFQYQQGATGSRVKRMVHTFPASDSSGKVEFAVIGDDYYKNGRILAWRASVSRGGRELASRQSYLWR